MIDQSAREDAFRTQQVEPELPPVTMVAISDDPDPLCRQVWAVHVRRLAAAAASGEVKRRRLEWEGQNRAYIEYAQLCSVELVEAEADLRVMALERFAETHDKAVCPGVSVRIVTRLAYTLTEALAWAKRTGIALSLDVKAFEKVARTGICGEFVNPIEEAQAMIATDLGKTLAG